MRNAIQDTIVQNQLQGNVVGIHLENSNGNAMFHNNFVSNTVQVEGASYNTWDDGYPSGGNHWSNYSGFDLYNGPSQNLTGSDGIGDSVYAIDADNVDRYPLMQQHLIPEFPSFLIPMLFMIATLLAVMVYRRKHRLDNSAVHLSEMSNPSM
jgi:parallel beta-helix repeat protein